VGTARAEKEAVVAEAKEAWSEVGARFGGLGEKLKEHFTHPPSKGAEAGEPEAAADAGAADALKDAFRKLGEALDGAVEAIGAAAKDPAVAGDVRQVGQALVNALSTTFTDAGEEVKKAFGRGRPADVTDTTGTDTTGTDTTGTDTTGTGETGE
jgi:Flp pilus assembly pilin Flp